MKFKIIIYTSLLLLVYGCANSSLGPDTFDRDSAQRISNVLWNEKQPGKEAYQGKLLEARQSDWKDEAVLIILSLPVVVLAWAVISDDPSAMDKVKLFFEMFSQLPSWFTNLWILVVASIYGIKGTQIFRNGGGKKWDNT